MEISFLLKGILLGFAIAAAVGPIGILCIQRTLQFGRFSGFMSGLGAAVADLLYAIIAAFGLTFISNFLVAGQFWVRLIGGGFLLLLGLKTFFAVVSDKTKEITHTTFYNDFISTFLLTITNPMIILFFLAVFAGPGLSSIQGNYFKAATLVVGIFLGSIIWWLILTEGISIFRKKFNKKVMRWINRIAGIIIVAFGIATILTVFFEE